MSRVHDAPAGLRLYPLKSPFLALIGPVHEVDTPGGGRRLAMRIAEHHCNVHGIAHGGTLMTLADVAMGNPFEPDGPGRSGVTISMSCDFAGAVQVGDWVHAHVDVQRRTNSLVFTNCFLTVGDERVFRASAVYKRVRKPASLVETPSCDVVN